MIQIKYKFFAIPFAFYLFKIGFIDYVLRGKLIFSYPLEQSYFFAQLIEFFISPAMLFFVSYHFGKKVNLKDELLVVVYSLFLGSIIGMLFFTGYILATSDLMEFSSPYQYAVNFGYFTFQALQMFFISFSAIAISYLKKNSDDRLIIDC